MSVVACFEALIIGIIGWNISKFNQGDQDSQSITRTNFFVIILLFLVVITLISIAASSIGNSKKNIITRLCELQNTYLMTPNFVTAQDHAYVSREKDLVEGGTAKILTNGLTYDISCSKNIAANIINGAKYIYTAKYSNCYRPIRTVYYKTCNGTR